ncbi:hypothetical protein [Luteimonas sp. MHLX1A]|nr:hypothetical protein [Luteimonas sp. MHLX1A]MCD9046826.1 hypothetical protein [Luteimonas sp. MHLX1A]
MFPSDQVDALMWAIKKLQGEAKDQLDRNRLHVLEQMRNQAEREARS